MSDTNATSGSGGGNGNDGTAPTTADTSGNANAAGTGTADTSIELRRRPRNLYSGSVKDMWKFQGTNPEIGAVLALRSEQVEVKKPFEVFVRDMKDFIRTKFETGNDLDPAFDKLESPIDSFDAKFIPKPPADTSNNILMEVMKEEIKLFAKRKFTMKNNISRAYTYVWGQCTPTLQACVRGELDHEEKCDESDLIWLLKTLKKLTAGVDEQANEYLTLYNGIAKLFSMRQFKTETNDAYLDRFNTKSSNSGHQLWQFFV